MRRMAACICLPLILGSCAGEADSPAPTTRHDPYPYTTPTPPPDTTPLDGSYARTVTAEVVGPAGACRRCPPYRLAVGEDILGLEKGVFEVYHRGSGYLSVGHFTSDGSTVTFFNDPNCPDDRGVYHVTSTNGAWSFEAVDDPCAFDDVRVQFLTSVPWMKIEPPEGVYTSPDGDLLVLLNAGITLEWDDRQITGTATRKGDLITVEGPTCRQELEWSVDQGRMTLATRSPVCGAEWITYLVDTQWTGVG